MSDLSAGVDLQRRVGRWRLTFDALWTELSRMPLDAAVLVLPADIEEWWDLRLPEPDPPYRTVQRIG